MNTRKNLLTATLVLAFAILISGLPLYSRTAQQTGGLKDACRLSLGATLKALQDYDYASGVGPLEKLHIFVMTHKEDPAARTETEARLLEFIKGRPNAGGLMAACRGLRLIGSAASVPVLGPLLLDPATADAARFALEKVPGPEACATLVSALGKTTGAVRLGIISSLGMRGTGSTVKPLAHLAGGNDLKTAAAAAVALGRIGNSEAVTSLRGLLKKSQPPVKEAVASGLLACAERLERASAVIDAAVLYDVVLTAYPASPAPSRASANIRPAAFRGKLSTTVRGGRELVLKALGGKDFSLHSPAISMVPRYFDGAAIAEFTPLFAGLPEQSRIELVAVLSGYPNDTARDTLMTALEDASPLVRTEALRGLGTIGGSASVERLARAAAVSSGAEQAVARESLARMKGPDVDRTLTSLLAGSADASLKAELIRAIAERRVGDAKPALMSMLGPPDTPAALKLKAAAALRNLVSTPDVPALAKLLLSIEDETLREAVEDATASAANSDPRIADRSGHIAGLCAGEKNADKKATLLRVLGKIGDDRSLAVVRASLADPAPAVSSAACRALADWPTVAARDDVLALASRPAGGVDPAAGVLALRAYIRMVGLEPYRAPEAAVADLEKALGLATRPEEKKLALAALTMFPCEKGLKLASALAADPAIKAEAEAAAAKMKKALGKN